MEKCANKSKKEKDMNLIECRCKDVQYMPLANQLFGKTIIELDGFVEMPSCIFIKIFMGTHRFRQIFRHNLQMTDPIKFTIKHYCLNSIRLINA